MSAIPREGFFQSLPVPTRWAMLLFAGLTAFLIFDQRPWWDLREEYLFGYIVPLFAAFILYDRWPMIRRVWIGPASEAEAAKPSPVAGTVLERLDGAKWPRWTLGALAFLAVIGGMLFFLVGALYRAMEGQNLVTSNALTIGYGAILLGSVYIFSDRRANGELIPVSERIFVSSLFLFPALIWFLSVPMVNALYTAVSTFLMNKVAVSVFGIFDLLGFAVIREGSVLKLPNGEVGVEDACSGIRSLMACLFAGSFLGAAFLAPRQFFKKVFLVATAMLFAFLNNILRSLFLTSWAYAYGPEALDEHVMVFGMDLGNIHDFTGWVVLVLTVLALLVIVRIFTFEFEVHDHDHPHDGDEAHGAADDVPAATR